MCEQIKYNLIVRFKLLNHFAIYNIFSMKLTHFESQVVKAVVDDSRFMRPLNCICDLWQIK